MQARGKACRPRRRSALAARRAPMVGAGKWMKKRESGADGADGLAEERSGWMNDIDGSVTIAMLMPSFQ
ncbi:MAG: hypothetical protein RMJ48_04050 [Roseiflexaceae bacterium]|nr:hypothetical protein [Roseiflexaceae bacterium]